jgi:peptide/nickel transport system permease protein
MRTGSNKIFFMASFFFDAVLVMLFLSAGLSGIESLVCAEFIMWLARLIRIDYTLFGFAVFRMLHILPMVVIVVALGFILIELAPGDSLTRMRLNPDIRPDTLAMFEKSFGLGEPWYVRLAKYAVNVLRGDFGYSELFKAPVATLVRARASNTLLLAAVSILVAWGISIPAGIAAATHRNKWQDRVVSVFSFIGLSMPSFFLAFLLACCVAATGAWLPIGGMQSVDFSAMPLIEKAVDLSRHMVLPVAVLATAMTAQLTRLVRANVLEILGQPYIKAARAKGMSEGRLARSHVLPNAINPMITIFGTQLGGILSGTVIVEQVLSWPGLGKLVLAATVGQDIYLVAGSLIYGVILVVAGNLVADVMLAVLDPRVRMSG